MSGNRLGRNDLCLCGSGKKYKKCCYPRTFLDFSRPNAGIPKPAVHRTPFEQQYGNLFGHNAPPSAARSRREQPADRDRGFPYTMVVCAPLPPFGEGEALAGTLAPPTPEQYRAKFEAIRQSNPHRATEVLLSYSQPEPFGHADVQVAMPADAQVILENGRIVDVVDLWQGNRIRMDNGVVGMVTQDRTLLHEFPDPPRPWKDGLWLSRVIGNIKHFGYEVIDFRWAGQTVTVTPDHPFWSASRQWWIPVGELMPGELVRVCGNAVAPVEAIGNRRAWNVELYNVEVEYFHNYFVGTGDDAVLVHNGPGYITRPLDPDGNPIPLGFKTVGEYEVFAARMKAGLPADTQPLFQGSSVAGRSYKTGKVFDEGRVSDLDVALVKDDLFLKGLDLGYKAKDGTRIGPLRPVQADALGLTKLQQELSELAGRPVKFMLYDSVESATSRGSFIWVK